MSNPVSMPTNQLPHPPKPPTNVAPNEKNIAPPPANGTKPPLPNVPPPNQKAKPSKLPMPPTNGAASNKKFPPPPPLGGQPQTVVPKPPASPNNVSRSASRASLPPPPSSLSRNASASRGSLPPPPSSQGSNAGSMKSGTPQSSNASKSTLLSPSANNKANSSLKRTDSSTIPPPPPNEGSPGIPPSSSSGKINSSSPGLPPAPSSRSSTGRNSVIPPPPGGNQNAGSKRKSLLPPPPSSSPATSTKSPSSSGGTKGRNSIIPPPPSGGNQNAGSKRNSLLPPPPSSSPATSTKSPSSSGGTKGRNSIIPPPPGGNQNTGRKRNLSSSPGSKSPRESIVPPPPSSSPGNKSSRGSIVPPPPSSSPGNKSPRGSIVPPPPSSSPGNKSPRGSIVPPPPSSSPGGKSPRGSIIPAPTSSAGTSTKAARMSIVPPAPSSVSPGNSPKSRGSIAPPPPPASSPVDSPKTTRGSVAPTNESRNSIAPPPPPPTKTSVTPPVAYEEISHVQATKSDTSTTLTSTSEPTQSKDVQSVDLKKEDVSPWVPPPPPSIKPKEESDTPGTPPPPPPPTKSSEESTERMLEKESVPAVAQAGESSSDEMSSTSGPIATTQVSDNPSTTSPAEEKHIEHSEESTIVTSTVVSKSSFEGAKGNPPEYAFEDTQKQGEESTTLEHEDTSNQSLEDQNSQSLSSPSRTETKHNMVTEETIPTNSETKENETGVVPTKTAGVSMQSTLSSNNPTSEPSSINSSGEIVGVSSSANMTVDKLPSKVVTAKNTTDNPPAYEDTAGVDTTPVSKSIAISAKIDEQTSSRETNVPSKLQPNFWSSNEQKGVKPKKQIGKLEPKTRPKNTSRSLGEISTSSQLSSHPKVTETAKPSSMTINTHSHGDKSDSEEKPLQQDQSTIGNNSRPGTPKGQSIPMLHSATATFPLTFLQDFTLKKTANADEVSPGVSPFSQTGFSPTQSFRGYSQHAIHSPHSYTSSTSSPTQRIREIATNLEQGHQALSAEVENTRRNIETLGTQSEHQKFLLKQQLERGHYELTRTLQETEAARKEFDAFATRRKQELQQVAAKYNIGMVDQLREHEIHIDRTIEDFERETERLVKEINEVAENYRRLDSSSFGFDTRYPALSGVTSTAAFTMSATSATSPLSHSHNCHSWQFRGDDNCVAKTEPNPENMRGSGHLRQSSNASDDNIRDASDGGEDNFKFPNELGDLQPKSPAHPSAKDILRGLNLGNTLNVTLDYETSKEIMSRAPKRKKSPPKRQKWPLVQRKISGAADELKYVRSLAELQGLVDGHALVDMQVYSADQGMELPEVLAESLDMLQKITQKVLPRLDVDHRKFVIFPDEDTLLHPEGLLKALFSLEKLLDSERKQQERRLDRVKGHAPSSEGRSPMVQPMTKGRMVERKSHSSHRRKVFAQLCHHIKAYIEDLRLLLTNCETFLVGLSLRERQKPRVERKGSTSPQEQGPSGSAGKQRKKRTNGGSKTPGDSRADIDRDIKDLVKLASLGKKGSK